MRFINSIEELPPPVLQNFTSLHKKYNFKSLMWCRVVSSGSYTAYQFIRKYGGGTQSICFSESCAVLEPMPYAMGNNWYDYESLVRAYGQPTFDPRAGLGALPYMWRS